MINTTALGKEIRKRRGLLSMKKVSDVLGMSVPTISRMENGHTGSPDYLMAIVKYFDIDLDDYLYDVSGRSDINLGKSQILWNQIH